MAQLNINLIPEFEEALAKFMEIRGIRTKTEAIRTAVSESLEIALRGSKGEDFSTWVGAGTKASQNPKQKFKSNDELWEKG